MSTAYKTLSREYAGIIYGKIRTCTGIPDAAESY